MLTEINWSPKGKQCMIPLMGVVEPLKTERRRAGTWGWGRGLDGEVVFNGDRVSILQDESVLEMAVTTVAQMLMCLTLLGCALKAAKTVYFTLSAFHHNFFFFF